MGFVLNGVRCTHVSKGECEKNDVYMVLVASEFGSNTSSGPSIQLDGDKLVVVANFVHVGSQVNSGNNVQEEVRRILASGFRAFFYCKKYFVLERWPS